ncbi:MAG TPA: PQQ-dependent sugar dehydrogenase [Xanthobacteraceae bacterium]|nr:PQQ-dependent sugar dehydrogenase [Xanthobacteraceae bacterium]
MRRPIGTLIAIIVLSTAIAGIVTPPGGPFITLTYAQTSTGLLQGSAAFGDWHADRPGTRRLIKPQDIPQPDQAQSASNAVRSVRRTDQKPIVPNGFEVNLYAQGLAGPRLMRTAPNGDVFVAESGAGRIRVMRPDGDHTVQPSIFASGLRYPFGIAFYPPGPDPQWVYIGNVDSVVRFPYRNGDTIARGAFEPVVPRLPFGGHLTRDVLFSTDGKIMYVSVGSGSNDGEGMESMAGGALQSFIASHALGATWGDETDRADVLTYDPDGKNARVFATGIRNCVSMALTPSGDTLWCATNERDGLGDDLPPDYITRVRDGAFYGWPWYYIGAREDPRHKNERPDLKDKITVPDILLQAHSAPLGMTFYDGDQFPAEYRGNIFAAEHGSWNRNKRTGYKIVRAIVKDGVPTGEYDDFALGFVINDDTVWGRPVGVAVAKDGALLVSEDTSGTIWRITYTGKAASAH